MSVNSTTRIVCGHWKPSPILTSQLSLNVPYLSWWAGILSIIWDEILYNQPDSPVFFIPMHNQFLFANHFSNVSPSHQPWDSHLLKLSLPPNLASLYHVVFRGLFLIFNSFLWVLFLTPLCPLTHIRGLEFLSLCLPTGCLLNFQSHFKVKLCGDFLSLPMP